MRCFTALEIPDVLRAALARAQDELRRADADVRWVDPPLLHLTLKFCGELDAAAVDRLKDALRELRVPRFRARVAGLGMFPRVVWAGCEAPELAGLAAELDRAAARAGVPPETRPFAGHVTLGRVKSRRNEGRLRTSVRAGAAAFFGDFEPAGIALMRSTLGPSGPRYERLELFVAQPKPT